MTPTGSPPTPSDLDPFRAESSLRFLKQHGVHPILLAIVSVAIVSIPLGVEQARLANLSDGHLQLALCQDVGRLLHSSKLECLSKPPVPAHFTILRDWPSAILLITLALSPALVYVQWLGFSELAKSFRDYKLLADISTGTRTSTHPALDKELVATNQYWAGIGSSTIVPLVIASGTVYVLQWSQENALYAAMADPRVASWPQKVAATWWASPQISPFSSAIFALTVVVGVYYICRMNLVGWRVVLLVSRVRNEFYCALDLSNRDGSYGWAPVARVFVGTYVAVAIHSIAIALALLMLGFGAAPMMIPLLLQWIILVPFYVVVPNAYILRSISKWKSGEVARLSAELGSSNLRTSDAVAISDQINTIHGLPKLPFINGKGWFAIIVTLLPFLLTLANFVLGVWAI